MLALSFGFVPISKSGVLRRSLLLLVEQSLVDKPTQNPIGEKTPRTNNQYPLT